MAERAGLWNQMEASSILELAGNHRVFKMIGDHRIDGGG
jgi:hypothetical protein